MKQRLQKIYWTGIAVTLLMALAAIALTARMRITDTHRYLSAMLQAAAEWTLDSNDDLQSLADSIAQSAPPMRVAFLTETGIILADSMTGADPGLAHYDDREIAAAREGRTGSSLRMSDAGASLVLSAAKRLSPGLILRLSYPVIEIAGLVVLYGSLLTALFLILYFFQRRGIARYAADQERQMDDVRKLLDGEISRVEAAFPEFQPSLDAISYRTRRLREDREEILRTMNLREDFIANASHELRSPLTSIRGFAEMLDEGMADTPEERQYCLSMIRSESGRMLEVINDILRLSRLEHGADREAPLTHAEPVAREVARALAPRAAEKGINIAVSGDAVIRAGEKDVWELLFNLTDNAVRYGREGGNVEILMEEGRIEVRDDGIGIDEEHIGHVFEQFYRVDDSRGGDMSGTGLGLSIVQAIAGNCGGTVRVESVYGEGSRFIMEFPVEEKT